MQTLSIAMEDALLTIRRNADAAWTMQESLVGKKCRCVAADPATPGRVYCGTEDAGLWRTDDGGGSWQACDALEPRHVTAVAVSTTEGIIFAGTEPSAVFCSTDGGDRWESLDGLSTLPSSSTWSFPPRPDTHHVRWIAPDPVAPSRLFVAIEAGALVRSEDGGRTWRDRVPGSPIDTHTLVAHARDRQRLYSAAGDGYFESHDRGLTWQKPEDGLRHRYVWSCIVDPQDPDTVVISSAQTAFDAHMTRRAESWIYRKTRGTGTDATAGNGAGWRPVQAGLPEPKGTSISTLALDPIEPGVAYAANNRGIFRSTDMGDTWQRLDVPWPERFLNQRVTGLAVAADIERST